MKKILATVLTFVSLLGSISVLSSAEEQNSSLVPFAGNLANETKMNISNANLTENLHSCFESFKNCLNSTSIFTNSIRLENQYTKCNKELSNCLKDNGLDSYKLVYSTRASVGDKFSYLLYLIKLFSCIGENNYWDCVNNY